MSDIKQAIWLCVEERDWRTALALTMEIRCSEERARTRAALATIFAPEMGGKGWQARERRAK